MAQVPILKETNRFLTLLLYGYEQNLSDRPISKHMHDTYVYPPGSELLLFPAAVDNTREVADQ
jgi:hypothetical protein